MPPRKRAASTTLDEPRRSRRTRTTAQKSNYFEDGDESDDPLSGETPVKSRKGDSVNRRRSKAEDVVSDEYEDDAAGDQGEDDEEENGGEDDDDEDDFDTKVTVVKVPGLRPDGGMDYADEYVHKNTALFLKDLKQNNNRPWLKCTPYPDSFPAYLLTHASS